SFELPCRWGIVLRTWQTPFSDCVIVAFLTETRDLHVGWIATPEGTDTMQGWRHELPWDRLANWRPNPKWR
ncbi:MAG: hypothetical protein ACK56Q_12260, partial [Pirellulaceae bacterium]